MLPAQPHHSLEHGALVCTAASRPMMHAEKQRIVFGHQDFEYSLPGDIQASFLWAPYTVNLTSHLTKW